MGWLFLLNKLANLLGLELLELKLAQLSKLLGWTIGKILSINKRNTAIWLE